MNETEHTSGPWHVFDRFGSAIGKEQGFEVHAGPNPTEGRWPHASCPNLPDGFRETFSKADAYLIAAAPDLLEALRDLCDAIPEATLEDDPPLRAWVNAGRAAIAKAEGR